MNMTKAVASIRTTRSVVARLEEPIKVSVIHYGRVETLLCPNLDCFTFTGRH